MDHRTMTTEHERLSDSPGNRGLMASAIQHMHYRVHTIISTPFFFLWRLTLPIFSFSHHALYKKHAIFKLNFIKFWLSFSSQDTNFIKDFFPKLLASSQTICSVDPTFENLCGIYLPKIIPISPSVYHNNLKSHTQSKSKTYQETAESNVINVTMTDKMIWVCVCVYALINHI